MTNIKIDHLTFERQSTWIIAFWWYYIDYFCWLEAWFSGEAGVGKQHVITAIKGRTVCKEKYISYRWSFSLKSEDLHRWHIFAISGRVRALENRAGVNNIWIVTWDNALASIFTLSGGDKQRFFWHSWRWWTFFSLIDEPTNHLRYKRKRAGCEGTLKSKARIHRSQSWSNIFKIKQSIIF